MHHQNQRQRHHHQNQRVTPPTATVMVESRMMREDYMILKENWKEDEIEIAEIINLKLNHQTPPCEGFFV
jgi:hypothetical protein